MGAGRLRGAAACARVMGWCALLLVGWLVRCAGFAAGCGAPGSLLVLASHSSRAWLAAFSPVVSACVSVWGCVWSFHVWSPFDVFELSVGDDWLLLLLSLLVTPPASGVVGWSCANWYPQPGPSCGWGGGLRSWRLLRCSCLKVYLPINTLCEPWPAVASRDCHESPCG